ncbi:uncharacterized protein, YhcH/YjgK/YiaL family [Serratia entomophila]|uniref:YhcH/YjgK/YiaL family protein n=1 Tax=Serratia entomophila TaxID=42906 RepID=UPI00217BF3AD|nr:YhcH/YjgK/YiaL family protein [Serratia entomophila]CAI1826606.1 uncharacterized protein, YhcH/YjgK/YiaL family [Serratia entomophila]CAI2927273.1 uncharacterized protein, YhcH/YjgK/YiaL family [Serratia entomophila]
MIHNSLFNPRYGRGLSPALAETLTTLRQQDLAELAPGRHAIDGDRIFMDVMTLMTGAEEEKRAVLHQEYTTLHLLISGEERFDYGLPGEWRSECAYDERNDVQLLGNGRLPQSLHLTHGMFVIVSQMEPYKCGCHWRRPQQIKKAVIKIHHRLLV